MGQLNYTTQQVNDLLNKVDEQIDVRDLFKVRGTLNVTDQGSIIEAQEQLAGTGSVGVYLITDSKGKIPSANEQAVELTSAIQTQLCLTSPDSITNGLLSGATSSVVLDSIGVSVGDIIALTRVKVSVADLASVLGISLSLNKDIELYQYKIWHTNDAKGTSFVNSNGKAVKSGASGLMTSWDKDQVNTIPTLLSKIDKMPSIGTSNMNDCLYDGAYPWCTLGRPDNSTGAYTLVVHRSSTADGNGYYTVDQTAYGRQGELGQVYKRIIFLKDDGTSEYGEWIRIDTMERYNAVLSRLAGLESGMSPFYYPFVSLGSIGGDSKSGTQDTLMQMLDDLIDPIVTPDRGGVFRALYNGSQIIVEQYAASYAQHKFTQVVRGQIIIDSTDATKIKWGYSDFRILVRDHNISVDDGWSEWRDVSPSKIASLEARITALENS